VVRDLPRELRLGEPALKKRHKVKAAGAEKPEREDRAVAVLLEPRDLVVEVLLARLVEDRARNIVQLHRSRQACRDEGVVEGPRLTLKSPSVIRFLLHVLSRFGQSASHVAISRSSSARCSSSSPPDHVQRDER
jgi:hypothetical protein